MPRIEQSIHTLTTDRRPAWHLPQDLPQAFAHLAGEIRASQSLLALEDDWDGEGSPGYDEATWRRAVNFVVDQALQMWGEHGVVIPTPKIRKGPQGSIDLHWRESSHELLVNIPVADDVPADYYGDDGADGKQIKGSIDLGQQGHDLMQWLMS